MAAQAAQLSIRQVPKGSNATLGPFPVQGNFGGREQRALEGTGRAGGGFNKARVWQEGMRRCQRACELEGSEGLSPQPVGENSGGTTGGKTNLLHCLSLHCQRSCSLSWKRIWGEGGPCSPANSIPAAAPLALCLQPARRRAARLGLAGALLEHREHRGASCRLPAPHLLPQQREGRSICLWASVEPRLGCARSWGQRGCAQIAGVARGD